VKAKLAPPTVPTAAPVPKADDKPAERVAGAAQRARSSNNLKQLLLAIHNYHDTTNRLPADITDKDGKPLLSWRVLLLPYMEQENLHKQFKLDEPWDSANNKKLLAQMPALFRTGFEPKDTTKTHYQVFAGPGTAFEPGKQLRLTDITDGLSNTIGIVEAGPPVEWTRPADVAYDAKKGFAKLDGPFKNVLMVALLDGSTREVNPAVKAELLGKFVTRAGGEVTDIDDLKPDLKPLKEDRELLSKMIQEMGALTKEVADLTAERAKLVGELLKTADLADANLEAIGDEYVRLKAQVEELKREIKAMKEQLGKR
jgi:hypothetical protein